MALEIAARELHSCYLDLVRFALIGGSDAERDLLARINRGELLICWIDAWLPFTASSSYAERDLLALLQAALWRATDLLGRQAGDYQSGGLTMGAGDCYWLAAKLTNGALQLATAARVADARKAAVLARDAAIEAEREGARRRALDLQRWQAEAEARAMAPH